MSTETKYMALPAVELIHLSNELGFSNELKWVYAVTRQVRWLPPSLCRADLAEVHRLPPAGRLLMRPSQSLQTSAS
jgi:hypothetical protein